ncbi:hypothetical protein ACFL1Y_01790 [Patescibacteria group bacterium]
MGKTFEQATKQLPIFKLVLVFLFAFVFSMSFLAAKKNSNQKRGVQVEKFNNK